MSLFSNSKPGDGILDLSPLAKFMGRERKHWKSAAEWLRDDEGARVGDRLDYLGERHVLHNGYWHVITPDLARMYGWEVDPPAAPIPEKSPLDKALEDFVAKRKAKREANGCDLEQVIDRAVKDAEAGHALDRAMQKLSPHEVLFHERLMPYRGANV